MAYIKQNYLIGQNFNLFTQAQLSTQDVVWNWTGRTLSGFMTPDFQFIEPGALTSFNEQEIDVSGVWNLDKNVPITLCCIPAENSNGQISVNFQESCVAAPTFDENHQYNDDKTLTATSSYNVYYDTTTIFEINAADGTIITDIKFESYGDMGYGINNIDNDSYINSGSSLNKDTKYKYSSGGGLPVDNHLTLSVWYTDNGILTYIPNQVYFDPSIFQSNN